VHFFLVLIATLFQKVSLKFTKQREKFDKFKSGFKFQFGVCLAKIAKKTKKKKEKKLEKGKRAAGNQFGPAREGAHGPARNPIRTVTLLSLSSH
jgi:hypothetical protein